MRTAFLDPDNRPEPKTDCFCVRCHKDIKPGHPRRYVIIEGWDFASVVHPDDATEANGYDWNNAPGMFPVGMDCARKIGLEFTKELPPIEGA